MAKKTTGARARSIWAELKVGDWVYLDSRLKFKRGRWQIVEMRDEGFVKIASESGVFQRETAMIRGDAIVGWFMGKDRQERAPMPTGTMISGPKVKTKAQQDRGDRLIEVE